MQANTGATIVGGYSSIVMHEAGHAVTSKLLGGEVLAFRPYPHKVKFLNTDGSYTEKWVAGLVMSKPFEGEGSQSKDAWVAAMGSGGNLMSVFLLAPLLPEMNSEFSRSALDSMLFFSSFDMAAYALADVVWQDKNNDWSRVAKLTGTSIYWYLAGGIVAGIIANEYRSYWHNRSLPGGKKDSSFSIGFSTSY